MRALSRYNDIHEYGILNNIRWQQEHINTVRINRNKKTKTRHENNGKQTNKLSAAHVQGKNGEIICTKFLRNFTIERRRREKTINQTAMRTER